MHSKNTHSVVLEGITIQHVGELLFDLDVTRNLRSICKDSYIQALEDFTFAVIFGDYFSVSEKLSQVGEDSPGEPILRRFKDFFVPVENDSTLKPEDIISSKYPGLRHRVKEYLKILENALNLLIKQWENWIIREAISYLGNDQSLWGNDPINFVFSKKPHPYFHDINLQSYIPINFINKLSKIVNNKANPDGIPIIAIKEFVTRSTLTHVTIMSWYERAVLKSKATSVTTLPFPTRSSLISLKSKRIIVDRIKNIVVPYLLHKSLDGLTSREQYLNRLEDIRDTKTIKKIRDRLSISIEELKQGDNRAAKKLFDEINEHSRFMSGDKVDQVSLNQVTLKTKVFDISINLNWVFNRNRYFIRRLIREYNEKVYLQTEDRIKRVFPELKGSAK